MYTRAFGEVVERDGVAVAAAVRQRIAASAAGWKMPCHQLRPRADCRPCPAACEWVLLHTSYSQSTMLPLASSAALALVEHRRAVGLPRMLLLAHPLHAHRRARQRPRDQRGVGRRIVGAVMAVAAGPLPYGCSARFSGGSRSISAMRLAIGIDALRVRPHGHQPLLEYGDRAGGSDRAVHLIGARKLRLQRLYCARRGPGADRVIVSCAGNASRIGRDRPAREAPPAPAIAPRSHGAHRRDRLIFALATTARKSPSRMTSRRPACLDGGVLDTSQLAP